jgi:regulator of protease activity HflC (stomatin/prohibitin superfamily)
LILVAAVIFGFFAVFVKRYGETERGIIYRFGAFHRVAGPGWSIVLPFFEEEFSRVDIRTRSEMLGGIPVVTRDDIPLTLDVAFFYSIADARKAILRVASITHTLPKFVHGVVRNGVGGFAMREVFYRMEDINEELRKRLLYAQESWGVNIENIEILRVNLPDHVLRALTAPVTAEQRAIAARFLAEARRVSIEVLGDAARRLHRDALTYLYLRALEKIASAPGSKIVLPMSFPSVVKGVGAGVGVGLGIGLSAEQEAKVIDQIAKRIAGKA